MDKKNKLKAVFTKKTKDYSYAAVFFIIFSFLTFFIIRPNILSVFEANLKIENLKKTNAFYEAEINNVINAQSVLIESRNDLGLLDEAITKKPQINELIRDVNGTVDKNRLSVNKMSLVDFNLKDVSQNDILKTIVFDLGIEGGFDNYLGFIKDLYDQRRLKLLKNINITTETPSGSGSATLIINCQLEGYYL